MKQRIAKLWIKALRSGKYEQGMGELRSVRGHEKWINGEWVTLESKTIGFCCLGVLCNIHAQLHPRLAKTQTDPTNYFGAESILPPNVAKWAGMKSNEGKLPRGSEEFELWDDLASMNDSGTADFKDIARAINEHWKKL